MKEKLTKYILFLALVMWAVPPLSGQTETKPKGYKIIRSNTGFGGSSKVFYTSKGMYVVSQSIGQSSVIGTANNNGYYLRQGYQQPHKPIKVIKTSVDGLKALVYPNPFNYSVQILLKESNSKNIAVEIYDVAGKMLYNKNFTPSKNIQLDLSHFSSGVYLLKAISDGKLFNSKLIKR